MAALVKTAKVSSKGRIGLPRIEPAGSLAQYARKRVPFRMARNKAWEAVVRAKHKRR